MISLCFSRLSHRSSELSHEISAAVVVCAGFWWTVCSNTKAIWSHQRTRLLVPNRDNYRLRQQIWSHTVVSSFRNPPSKLDSLIALQLIDRVHFHRHTLIWFSVTSRGSMLTTIFEFLGARGAGPVAFLTIGLTGLTVFFTPPIGPAFGLFRLCWFRLTFFWLSMMLSSDWSSLEDILIEFGWLFWWKEWRVGRRWDVVALTCDYECADMVNDW